MRHVRTGVYVSYCIQKLGVGRANHALFWVQDAAGRSTLAVVVSGSATWIARGGCWVGGGSCSTAHHAGCLVGKLDCLWLLLGGRGRLYWGCWCATF